MLWPTVTGESSSSSSSCLLPLRYSLRQISICISKKKEEKGDGMRSISVKKYTKTGRLKYTIVIQCISTIFALCVLQNFLFTCLTYYKLKNVYAIHANQCSKTTWLAYTCTCTSVSGLPIFNKILSMISVS